MRVRKTPLLLLAVFMNYPTLSFATTEPQPLSKPQSETKIPSAQDNFLLPYSAVYSTVWKKGISLKVKGKQALSKLDGNDWQFVFSADSMLASLYESSIFHVKDHQIIPILYEYKTSALGKKRSAILTFNWEKNLVRNDIKDKPWNLSINPNTLDKLSIQLQVRQDLKQGKNDFDYQIADGGHIKNWHFRRLQMETVNTKIGRFPAIKVIRTDNLGEGKKTAFWFAPTHDYLLVKLEHTEDGESYQLDIESLSQP
ncbi:DUF3108 domain-containing protein [Marinomonas algarum]|uniref:DUF3108 domain-containing protein n=1 Tax=Marinomonas algarum TaxID=2883105 RepID=A0A9X1IMW3_9GAMM|nr:DUF3108 domain-containing protein [Marinomonas algarum]MCB5162165.1 DUF3108 domain-containing protein [Marinomonas algarum]